MSLRKPSQRPLGNHLLQLRSTCRATLRPCAVDSSSSPLSTSACRAWRTSPPAWPRSSPVSIWRPPNRRRSSSTGAKADRSLVWLGASFPSGPRPRACTLRLPCDQRPCHSHRQGQHQAAPPGCLLGQTAGAHPRRCSCIPLPCYCSPATLPTTCSRVESVAPSGVPGSVVRIIHTGAKPPTVLKRTTLFVDQPPPHPSLRIKKYG